MAVLTGEGVAAGMATLAGVGEEGDDSEFLWTKGKIGRGNGSSHLGTCGDTNGEGRGSRRRRWQHWRCGWPKQGLGTTRVIVLGGEEIGEGNGRRGKRGMGTVERRDTEGTGWQSVRTGASGRDGM